MSNQSNLTYTEPTNRCTNIHRGRKGAKDSQCPHIASPGKKWCERCLSRQASNRKQRIALGMCESCPEPTSPGKLRCPKHLQSARDHAKTRRDRMIRDKLCVEYHGEVSPPATHGTMCEPCWYASIARSALGVRTRDEARKRGPELRNLFQNQGGRCAYTGVDLVPGVNASLDHRVPKALGGDGSLGNLQWVTFNVNRAKNSLMEGDFIAMCRDVVRHRMR